MLKKYISFKALFWPKNTLTEEDISISAKVSPHCGGAITILQAVFEYFISAEILPYWWKWWEKNKANFWTQSEKGTTDKFPLELSPTNQKNLKLNMKLLVKKNCNVGKCVRGIIKERVTPPNVIKCNHCAQKKPSGIGDTPLPFAEKM